MNYTIFSIDDRRKAYTDRIRKQLSGSYWWNEAKIHCINGTNPDKPLHEWLGWFGLEVRSPDIKVGQLGIWLTVLSSMELGFENYVTFEDDAILHPAFNSLFWKFTDHLPDDTDAFALFLPRDQDHLAGEEVAPGIVRAYQRYGGVSMMWTPQGVERFKRLSARDGITDQWDDQLFKYAKSGEMNVYTQSPGPNVLVSITGKEESIVQESERYK